MTSFISHVLLQRNLRGYLLTLCFLVANCAALWYSWIAIVALWPVVLAFELVSIRLISLPVLFPVPHAPVSTDPTTAPLYVVTGGSSGLGFEVAHRLLRAGYRVCVTHHSRAKEDVLLKFVSVLEKPEQLALLSTCQIDLGDVTSIVQGVKTLTSMGPLQVLINNAGAFFPQHIGTKAWENAMMGVNYSGPTLLTLLLLPALLKTATSDSSGAVRIVNVASGAHHLATPKLLEHYVQEPAQKGDSNVKALRYYALSKLCNIMFTRQLQKLLDTGYTNSTDKKTLIPHPQAHVYSMNPSGFASDLNRNAASSSLMTYIRLFSLKHLIGRSTVDASHTVLHCALGTASGKDKGPLPGRYHDQCAARNDCSSPLSYNEQACSALWLSTLADLLQKPGVTKQLLVQPLLDAGVSVVLPEIMKEGSETQKAVTVKGQATVIDSETKKDK